MGRSHRVDPPGGWHHVMNRGVDHQPIFFGDQDRVEFGRLLGVVHDEFGVDIHAYCLMDNHFHLLVQCPNGGLSDAMQHLCSVFARHVNDRVGRDGTLFRSRFCSRLLGDPTYVVNVVRYIHRNALDIAGVGHVDQYRWSSHRTYLALRRRPYWLRTDTVLAWFDDDRRAFADFVEFAAGSEHLRAALRASDLLELIDLELPEILDSGPRRRPAVVRSVALLAAEHVSERLRDDVVQALGIPSDAAAAVARCRARQMAASCDDIGRTVDAVLRIAAATGLPLVPGTNRNPLSAGSG